MSESVDPSVSLFPLSEFPCTEVLMNSSSATEHCFGVVVRLDRRVVVLLDSGKSVKKFLAVINLLKPIELELDNLFFYLLSLAETCS